MFTRTKHGANRLTKQLQDDGIQAAAIHGNKSQSARTQALADFKNYDVRALVATEVASRGLDIKELPHVVNYELPNVPEDYVHRIGRTGRAGATGIAVSLVAPDEAGLLKDIEKVLRKPIPQLPLPHFARSQPQPQRAPAEAARHSQPRQQQLAAEAATVAAEAAALAIEAAARARKEEESAPPLESLTRAAAERRCTRPLARR